MKGSMNDDQKQRAGAIRFGSRDNKVAIEEGPGFAPKFDKDGLITAVAVDALTGTVLMVAYMNEESLRRTLACGEAVYFSRSRQKLWHKGEESGHVQKIVEILTDCDQDALVLRVDQRGPGACHTGYRSCFYRAVALDGDEAALRVVYPQKGYDPAAVYRGGKPG
jgi:phosphoribosyl-AMP cyclohydrolase